MKNVTRHTGTIRNLERLDSSINGNPRYCATLADDAGGIVTFITAVDSSLAYELPNHLDKPVAVAVGDHYGRATLDAISPL